MVYLGLSQTSMMKLFAKIEWAKNRYLFSTAQKMKLFITDFFSKCDQIQRKLRIWSHLLKNSAVKNFIFCAVLAKSFIKDN